MQPHGISLPPLGRLHRAALEACVEAMFSQYDVVAIIASGTIVRGDPDRRSDLDVFVLHRGAFCERLQRFFEGIPCEIFVNPADRIPQYFEDEARRRRPITAHMFATGEIIFDPEGVAARLAATAKEALSRTPPAPDAGSLPALRYGPATMFEDAEDLVERDPEAATLLLGNAVYELVKCHLAAQPGWIPRHKDFLAELRCIDPESASLAVAASWRPFQPNRSRAAALPARHRRRRLLRVDRPREPLLPKGQNEVS